MRRLPFAVIVIALAGCATATERRAINGTEWRVTALNSGPISDAAARASFHGEQFTISFGCNTGSGIYRLQSDRLIPVEGLSRTLMACAGASDDGPDLMEREDRGFAIASRPMILTWRGKRHMTLSNEAGSIDLWR